MFPYGSYKNPEDSTVRGKSLKFLFNFLSDIRSLILKQYQIIRLTLITNIISRKVIRIKTLKKSIEINI